MAQLTTEARNNLPDSKFAYVDENGVGHFPIQDAAHVRNALARLGQSPFGGKARPKVLAAARRFGIAVGDDSEKSLGYDFTFDIQKAEVSERNGKMMIRGVASTMGVDRQDEQMSQAAMDSMLKQIRGGKVPLHNEHGRNWNDRIGNVTGGELDSAGNLVIEAELNQRHPIAKFLYDSIKSGETLGLSVAGKVKGFTQQMRTDLGKVVRTLGDVVLREISVTKHPANLDTIGLTAKSYIYDIAKSVPEEAWLMSEKGTYMEEETPVVETAETGEPTGQETPTTEVAEATAEVTEEQAQEETVAAVPTDESTVDAVTGASETEAVEKAMKLPAADRKALIAKMEAAHQSHMKGMQDAHEAHMKALMSGVGGPVGPGETEPDADDATKSMRDETVVMKALRKLIETQEAPKGIDKVTKALSEVMDEELVQTRTELTKMAQVIKSQGAALEKLMTMPLQRKGNALAADAGKTVEIREATIVEKSADEAPKAAGSLAEHLINAPYVPVTR